MNDTFEYGQFEFEILPLKNLFISHQLILLLVIQLNIKIT